MFEPSPAKLGEYARAAARSTDALWALDAYITALAARDRAREQDFPLEESKAEVAACRGELEFQLGCFPF